MRRVTKRTFPPVARYRTRPSHPRAFSVYDYVVCCFSMAARILGIVPLSRRTYTLFARSRSAGGISRCRPELDARGTRCFGMLERANGEHGPRDNASDPTAPPAIDRLMPGVFVPVAIIASKNPGKKASTR